MAKLTIDTQKPAVLAATSLLFTAAVSLSLYQLCQLGSRSNPAPPRAQSGSTTDSPAGKPVSASSVSYRAKIVSDKRHYQYHRGFYLDFGAWIES